MSVEFIYPEFEVVRNESKCTACRVCERQCANEVHQFDKEHHVMKCDETRCVNCQRCVSLCPARSSMGNPKPLPVYWDKILINASQVTNPSIDPLREPMETRVYLGKKPQKIQRTKDGKLKCELPPQLKLSMPVMFSAMVASGRFGVHEEYLNAGSAIEIKMGQGAKPGIGGHLPGAKIVGDVSRTRMIPEGSDAISPAPHHDIYSIEDLRQLVFSLKEATEYKKPIIVKVAAVHNIAAIASGIARSGADIIAIDGFRGGTGAAPTRIRDNVGIPIELALAAVDQRLRDEGIRNNVSLIAGGSIRSAADVVKAIALGADACYIATAALLAMGCHLCRTCQSGKCNWGIATQRPDLVTRLNPEIGSKRLINLMTAWKHEIKELMGGMGINSIEALRGNRLMLRGIGLNEKELEILGISYAGE